MRTRTISARLWMIVGFITAALTALWWSSQMFQARIGADYQLRQQLSQAQSLWLAMRSAEKDYLHYKLEDYANAYQRLLDDLTRQLDALEAQLATADHISVEITPVRTGINAYADAFAAVVALQQHIGLTPEDGLYGTLRASAHDVEAVVGEDPALLASLLMLRRHEKDFMLRRNPRYATRFSTALSDFRGALFLSEIDNQIKAQLQTALRQYSDSFSKLVQAEIDIGLDDTSGLIGAMRSQVEHADTLFGDTFGILQQRIDSDARQAREAQSAAVIAIILVSVALLLYTRRRITRNLNTAVASAQALGSGDLDTPITHTQHDEVGTLLDAMEQMRSQLLAMRLAAADDARVRDALAALSHVLQGVKDTRTLAAELITHLANAWQAQVGAVYLLKGDQLAFSAGYGLAREQCHAHYALGEALIGQAAETRQMLHFTNTPPDYLRVSSGTGSARPASVLVVPLVWNDSLYGALELGALTPFSHHIEPFFAQAAEVIAIALHAARTRHDMNDMLAHAQHQAQTLSTQQQALAKQNADMLMKTEQLQASEEELRVQQEELQAQQEELRVLNEELEAQTRMMNDRTRSLEQRNHELETRLRENMH